MIKKAYRGNILYSKYEKRPPSNQLKTKNAFRKVRFTVHAYPQTNGYCVCVCVRVCVFVCTGCHKNMRLCSHLWSRAYTHKYSSMNFCKVNINRISFECCFAVVLVVVRNGEKETRNLMCTTESTRIRRFDFESLRPSYILCRIV